MPTISTDIQRISRQKPQLFNLITAIPATKSASGTPTPQNKTFPLKIGNFAGQKSYSLSDILPPTVTSPSLDQYLQLSPKERALQDRLYFEHLMNPRRLAFLAGLLKTSIRTQKPSQLHRGQSFLLAARNSSASRVLSLTNNASSRLVLKSPPITTAFTVGIRRRCKSSAWAVICSMASSRFRILYSSFPRLRLLLR
jgi:hypothetical protein